MKAFCINFIFFVSIANPTVFGQSPIGDGRPATEATLEFPSGIAIDSNGHVFIAERGGNRIRKVNAKTGIISTFVGTGSASYSGDGNLATLSTIAHPELIAIDNNDNLFIADRSNGRIRKVDSQTNFITTIIGGSEAGYSGDGQPMEEAKISYPYGIGFDKHHNLLIADTENHVIRKVDISLGVIKTVAGNGTSGFGGDGGPADEAQLNRPHNFTFTINGDLIIGDSRNLRIRKVDSKTGIISTLYGKGEIGFSEDGSPASEAKFGFFGSLLTYNKMLFFSEWINERIRIIDLNTGTMDSLKNSDGEVIKVDGPYGLAIYDNSLFFVEANKNRIFKMDLETLEVTHFAGK